MFLFLYHAIHAELRAWPRRKWHYGRRLAYVGLMALVVFWGYGHGLINQAGAKGILLLQDLGVLVLTLSLFTAPMSVASRLQLERREQTLGLLLLTGVGTGEYLCSRLVSAMAAMLVSLLSVLPLLLLAASMGGVTIGQWLASGTLLAGVMVSASALGLFLCTWLQRDRWLYLAILLALLFWQVGLPLLSFIGATQMPWVSHFKSSSVILVFLAILRDPEQQWLPLLLPYLAWTVGWVLLFLSLGALRLRPWALREPQSPRQRRS